jgi:hypothetical protein
VVFHYFRRTAAAGDVILEVLDERGARVRRLSSAPAPLSGASEFEEFPEEPRKGALTAAAGVQRAVWDLRYDGAGRVQDARIDYGDPSVGPLALPGLYTLRLTAGGHTVDTTVRVLPDPRVQVAAADQAAQLAFALGVRDDISRLTGLITDIRAVRAQLLARKGALPGDERMGTLVADIDAALARLTTLEEQVHNPQAEVVYDILAMKGGAKLYSRLSPLMGFADTEGPTTQGLREVHATLRAELDAALAAWAQVSSGEIAAVNARARELGLGFVNVPAR